MKKIFMSLCAMLTMASSAFADDTFSVDAVTLPVNTTADLVVNFSLDQGSTCEGYNFNLQLPSQLEFDTYIKNDEIRVVYTPGDCYDEEVANITANLDNGVLKVAYLNTNGDLLTKQSGVLVTFKVKVKAGATVAVGNNLTGTLTEGTIANEFGQSHNVADSQFTITIGEAIDLHTILDELSEDVPAATTEPVDVRVKRTINANQWSTICLPFAMTAEQVTAAFGTDVELADFLHAAPEYEGEDVVKITLNFNSVTAIEANHPYVIKVSTPIDYENGFTVDGVIVSPSDQLSVDRDETKIQIKGKWYTFYNSFVGNYVNGTFVPEGYLFLSNNQFWYSTGLTQMKAFRAYFDLMDVLSDTSASAPVFINIGGETTRLDQLNIENNDDNYYTLDGRAVKTPGKGVYIHRGKKIIIK